MVLNNLFHTAFLLIALYLNIFCMVRGLVCNWTSRHSGIIEDAEHYHTGLFYPTTPLYLSTNTEPRFYSTSYPFTSSDGKATVRSWLISRPPRYLSVKLDFKYLTAYGYDCNFTYVTISVWNTKEKFKFCPGDSASKPVIASDDVEIIYSKAHSANARFSIHYSIGNFTCKTRNCSNGDDEDDCGYLNKGISNIEGIKSSRNYAIAWLKRQRSTSFGWGKNTHRAITALYLSNSSSFRGHDLEEELMVKQLELQTSVALMRNSSNPISVSELSMFVNALTVTCHNPRRFYGSDLLQILGDRLATTETPTPNAYLTLCNLNWTISESDIKTLLKPLYKRSKYPFHTDMQAMTVMALSCIKNKTTAFTKVMHAASLYDASIKSLISMQLPDGSFSSNVYTTALVTQALISSGQESNKLWNMTSTAQYLMKHLNTIDFLSAYFTLPIFSGRTLLDIASVDCSNRTRKLESDDDISEVTDKLGGKTYIQYSLFVGDQKDVIHTMYLRMPVNSSAYDVMKVAQVADSKYKFLYTIVSGQMYVYDIAGITNDPEAGKFWLLYTGENDINGSVTHHTESPNKFLLKDKDHLIMWYRTANFYDEVDHGVN